MHSSSRHGKLEQSCGVIPVWHDGQRWRWLLVQHQTGHWGFPKGHVEPGETPVETAKRELWEETGIRQVELLARVQYSESYSLSQGANPNRKRVIYFVGRVANSSIRRHPEELIDAHWFDIATALRVLEFASVRQILRSAYRAVLHYQPWTLRHSAVKKTSFSEARIRR